MTDNLSNPDRIVRSRELCQRLGVSPMTLWRMRQRGELPHPLKISAGCVGWRESTIAQLLDQREAEALAGEAA